MAATCAAASVIDCPFAFSEELDSLCHNLRDIAFLPVLRVVGARPDLPLNVEGCSLLHVVPDDVCEVAPRDDVVPLGLLVGVSVPVLEPLAGGEGELGEGRAVFKVSDVGVLADIPD